MRIIAIFVVLMLLFGCLGEWRTIAEPAGFMEKSKDGSAKGPAEKIGYVYVEQEYGDYYNDESDSYAVQFTLEDANGNVVIADGTVSVIITDEENNVLYTGTEAVSSSDFEEKTGYPFYDNYAYTYMISFDDITTSETSYADFEVEFQMGSSTFSKTRNEYLAWDLISDYYDYDYSYDDLTAVGVSETEGDIKVTVTEAGISSDYYNDYTVNFDIENTGSKKQEIILRELTIVTSGKQYNYELYSYEKDVGDIYPSAAVSNSFVFYEVEELGDNVTMYLELAVWEGGEFKEELEYSITYPS